MKKFNLLSALTIVSALVFSWSLSACQQPSDEVTPTVEDSSTPEIPSESESTNDSTPTDSESTPSESESTPSDSSSSEDVSYETITIAEAIELANAAGEAGTVDEYVISARITSIDNPTFGAMYVEDETGSLYVYGVVSLDGDTRYDAFEEKPVAGDDIVLKGKLKTFKGTPEMDRGYMISYTHNDPSENIDLSQYTEQSIAQARSASDESKVIVDGVVAHITHASGFIPNGFYLVDETSSMYVYDSQIAAQVSVGNTISIAAIKDYYVLASEQGNADKFGYQGCNQLTNPVLLSNDKANTEFNKSWVSETTVKNLIETPVNTDVTTLIYKVNAYINRVDGTSFTNYYINDLDGTTGSYTYTQCNGNDFAWLDEFNGKICTVYLTAHNAKATDSSCFFRFIPIAVSYDNYQFDYAKTNEFVLEYYAVDQFKDTYLADPALEVVTNVTNTIVNFENVSVSYASDNSDVVYFAEENGKTVMHTGNEGVANITITSTYNGASLSETVIIKVGKQQEFDAVNVATAIAANDGEVVQVRGIVSSSLVNRTGFYIIDETGVIAILCEESDLVDIHQGDEVVIRGTRVHFKKPESTAISGQSCLQNIEILANYYGNNEYSKASFDSSYTISQLYDLPAAEDYTTQVYVVTGKIVLQGNAFYSQILIQDMTGTKQLRLYCSGANQYEFASAHANKEITMELCLCNWNDKSYYTGCLISITVDGVTYYNELNFTA